MSPQLIQIAECLNEANTREIKIARCLAESLKRIQELEQSKTEASQQAKEAEKRFSAALHDLAEQLTKTGEETTSIAQHLSNQINTEKEQFSTELTNVVNQLTKTSEQAKVEFGYKVDEIALKLAELPAQMAAFKAEFAIPSVQADAPKSFNPRGAYENGEKYQPFDYVSSNGSSYIALVENPTEPPSKRSKQWMLVAARGASGSGGIISASEVVGLGTAATRDVGQAANNVAIFSANDTFGSLSIQVIGGQVSAFSNFQLGINSTLIYGASVNDVTLTCPNTSGTLALLSQVGDRYLTSSTTSNTVSNGAKTFTVGTGLAYTPTQDITIVNDAAHHMHAAVTTYNSTTGELVVDVNSHTGTGTYTAWTVNVGGISSAVIPTDGATGTVLTKASSTNYDAVWSTPSVAVGSITGLGTGVATALAVNVGSAGAPLVFNGAGGTPSSITLTNATGYPAATTTTAGTVPGIGGFPLTNATNFFSLVHRYRAIPVTAQTWTNAGTGTGSVGGEPGAMRYGGSTGVTTLSTLRFYLNNVGNTFQGALHDVNSNSTLNFSARWAFTFQFFTDSQHANATTYFMLGIAVGTAYGAPATKSVGLRVVNGTGVGFAHDGTTLNVSSTIGTFTGFVSNVLTIENMGTGTVNFYLNGVLSVTMTNGPTGMSANSGETFVVAFTNGATATSNRAFILSASALRMN